MDIKGVLEALGLTDESTRLAFTAVASAIVSVIGAIVSGLAARRTKAHMRAERRTWEAQRVIYLHGFLTAPHYADARRRLRSLNGDIKNWVPAEHDKDMDVVSTGYDQAGFMLLDNDYVAEADRKTLLGSSWGQSIVDQYELIRKREEVLEKTSDASGRANLRTTQNFFKHFTKLYQETCIVRKKQPRHEPSSALLSQPENASP